MVGKNWYNPVILSNPSGVIVTVIAKQEGGYLNTVTTCATPPSTLLTLSVWVLSSKAFSFTLIRAVTG